MTISELFSNFASNIKVSNSDMEKIRNRRDQIANRINIDFWGSQSYQNHRIFAGSFGRGTKTHFSDIDLIVQLPYDVYCRYNNHTYNGQSALLQAVKSSLQKTYPTTHISGDGQIVALQFQDEIGFEIVPAFENKDGSFTYPDTNNGGSWKNTNPRAEIDAINGLDKECNGSVKIFAQMIREWKYTNNVDIPGILIDIFVYNFIKNYKYRDKSFLYFDYYTRDFFKYISDIPTTQRNFQIMGSGKYITFDGSFQYKAKQAYNKALQAIEYDNQNHEVSSSIHKWREIYGNRI